MDLYEMSLSMSLLGFRIGTMLATFHMCDSMLLLKAVFNMLVRNANPFPGVFSHVVSLCGFAYYVDG